VEGLKPGQALTVTNTQFSLSSDVFLIQRVSKRQKALHLWESRVTCATTLFGIMELFKLLLDDDLEIDAGQTVGLIQAANETITVSVATSTSLDSNLVYKWGVDAHSGSWNFAQWS
jgi:hypothetical protein